ncbi:MAG: (Fe-S)-binding protein [Candidatus Caldarchaeum sp.]
MMPAYAELLNDKSLSESITACFQCGACTAACPLNMFNGVRLSPRQMLRRMQLGLPTNIDPYLCMMCRACEAICPRGVKVSEVVTALRKIWFKQNRTPAPLTQALWRVYEEGNPWGYSSRLRGRWLDGLDANIAGRKSETLLYVGCISSYDIRLQRIAKAVAQLLLKAGVDFTVLGQEERCCGDSIYNTGETDFLEELVQENIGRFNAYGVKRIIAISPHCLRMFRDIYPRYGGEYEALHYTEFLTELLDSGRLAVNASLTAKATYHDPCYLGRYMKIYEQPRKLIENVKGLSFEEMTLSKELALCCGGGGGRILMESKPEERPSNQRVRQAAETGAEILVTTCPYCIVNFEDSSKIQRTPVKVMDLAELLYGAAGGQLG